MKPHSWLTQCSRTCAKWYHGPDSRYHPSVYSPWPCTQRCTEKAVGAVKSTWQRNICGIKLKRVSVHKVSYKPSPTWATDMLQCGGTDFYSIFPKFLWNLTSLFPGLVHAHYFSMNLSVHSVFVHRLYLFHLLCPGAYLKKKKCSVCTDNSID